MDWDTIKIVLVGIAAALIVAVVAKLVIIYGSYAIKQLGLWIF